MGTHPIFESDFDCLTELNMSTERTFIAIKPDGVQRGLVGKILKRFEQRGFKLVAMKLCAPGRAHMEKHYADLKSKPFFAGLVNYMNSGPICAMVWEGLNVVKMGRMMLGETNPQASLPGSIRGDFSIQVGRNICHGSDAVESAQQEIALWFRPDELINWESAMYTWIYEEPAAPAPKAAQGDFAPLNSAQLAEFDTFLLQNSYVSGFAPSQDDVVRFLQIKLVPEGLKNVARWWRHIASFQAEFDSLPGDRNQKPTAPVAAPAPAAAEEEEDDDDVDLFGDDDDEDAEAEAERIKAERVAAYNAKKAEKEAKKGKVIAKSNIILDIKPWDDETDMAELEELVREIEMDGLLWGTARLVAIGYGIKKLQITTVVEDDKVSTDDLEEAITAFEDHVQSVDIVAFNKI